MIASRQVRWVAGVLVALTLVACTCRRQRFPSRGDAAAVVVVAPRKDAAGPPKLAEQEPNDSPEQAQVLTINPDWPLVGLEGSLAVPGEGKGKDVDVFKLVVPGSRETPAAPTPDSGREPEDPRGRARRLILEVAIEGGSGVLVQLLDEGLKVMSSISVDVGAPAGIPNLAVSPGLAYYVRVKPAAKAGKTGEPAGGATKYKLTVQIGDFEVADEREPNDTKETSTPVALVGAAEVSGYHGGQRDQDFYRIPSPEIAFALDVDLDGVEGVGASLQVVDGSGTRLAFGRGRKGERLALHNVFVKPALPDAAPASRFLYVVVRAESGENRLQRYVMHMASGAPRLDAESEPNDSFESATPIKDGTVSGYLPVGDVDCFRYEGEGQREVTFEVACPGRVRGKLEAFRAGTSEPIAASSAKKARQTVALAGIATMGQPVVLRLSQSKGDGNANEPYSLRVTSSPSVAPNPGATNLSPPPSQ